MSEKPTVIEALSAVMADVQAVKKGDRNTQQNYSFRGIDAVVNAVGPVLRKHGVVAVPAAVEAHYRDVQTSQGKPSRECTVKVTYRFYGPAGDSIDVEVPGESMDFGDKGAPKAMSVAYRIALLQALCIPTDDTEPDAQSYERQEPIAVRDPGRTRGQTTRTKPDGPTDDPWTAPLTRTTDVEWFADIRSRLDLCGTGGEVRGLIEEARGKWTEGRLSDEDAQTWKQATEARMTELGVTA